MNKERFRTFAWATLALNLAVIVWGAYVRASGSGAGCGSHWPTCNGEILPRPRSIETVVEFTHRITSGLSGLLVLIELGWAFLVLPRRHLARAGAVASTVFMLSEGAVGAALVLLRHVAGDRSAARAAWTSLHLSNTFFLVAALTLTAYWASRSPVTMEGAPPNRPRLTGQGISGTLLLIGAIALLLTAVSGAITALGDTLFTASSLARGIADDLSPTAHFLQQLRVLHPVMAIFAAVFLLYARTPIAAERGADAAQFSRLLAGLVVAQLLVGMTNFLLRAPVALQLVHLALADLVWVVFVLLGAAALGAVPSPTPAALTVDDGGFTPKAAPRP